MAGEKYFSIIPLAYLAAESIPFAEIAMTSASITFRSESGFTLMELMMVITIVSVLTVASLTPISNTIDQSRFDETVSRIKVIRDAMLGDPTIKDGGLRSSFGFLGDLGSIPSAVQGIAALSTNPGLPAWTLDTTVRFGRGWNGPYITSAQAGTNFTLDGWGRALIYSPTATPPSITSYGADGVAGGTGFNTDIVVQLPTNLQTAMVYGFISNSGSAYAGPATIDINYLNGSGALSLGSTTILAANKGAFSFNNIPLGKRSATVYIPSKAAPTTTIGPVLFTVDNSNFVIPANSFDTGTSGSGTGTGGCTAGIITYAAGTMTLGSGNKKLTIKTNVSTNITLSKLAITSARVASWSTFNFFGTASNCNGGGTNVWPCPTNADGTLGAITPTVAVASGNNLTSDFTFNVSMLGSGNIDIEFDHNLGCDIISLTGL